MLTMSTIWHNFDKVNHYFQQVFLPMKSDAKIPYSLFAVIAAAILLVIVLIKSKEGVEHSLESVPDQSAEVITIQKIPYRVKITGYGNVKPAISFTSMSEVSGKVSYIHPNLKTGERLPAGNAVIRIEAKDYEIALKQSEADL